MAQVELRNAHVRVHRADQPLERAGPRLEAVPTAVLDRVDDLQQSREDLLQRMGPLPAPRADRAWAALRLAEALFAQAAAAPRHPAYGAWTDEARRLVRSVDRADGKASVPAGSEPGYLEVLDELTARAARN